MGTRCRLGEAESVDQGLGEMLPVQELSAQEPNAEAAEAGEEAEIPRLLPTPIVPSKSEIDAHRVTHCPYRSWCRHCREGSGLDMPHAACDQEARKIPIVGFDYMFIGKRRVYRRGENFVDGDKPENVLKVLIVRCHKSKALFAHAVPQKGIDEKHYVVDCLTQDILWLGYPRVLLKCDTEKSIMAVLRESLKSLKVEGMEASSELPAPYDPQSNGGTEV